MSSSREVETEPTSDQEVELENPLWVIPALVVLLIVLIWELLSLPAKVYRWFREDPAKRALRRWTKRSN